MFRDSISPARLTRRPLHETSARSCRTGFCGGPKKVSHLALDAIMIRSALARLDGHPEVAMRRARFGPSAGLAIALFNLGKAKLALGSPRQCKTAVDQSAQSCCRASRRTRSAIDQRREVAQRSVEENGRGVPSPSPEAGRQTGSGGCQGSAEHLGALTCLARRSIII